MAVELTGNKRKRVKGEYKGKRKLATKRLADVTKEELEAWEKRTGKKGLRAYLNAQRTIKSKGERLQQGDVWRQAQRKARDAKPRTATKTREQYAAASQKAGTSAAGMKPKKVDRKPTGGGSDKMMEKKRSLVNRLRDRISKLGLRDVAGEKLAEKRRLANLGGPSMRGGGRVKVSGYKAGGSIKGRKKSIDGVARKGKTKARHR